VVYLVWWQKLDSCTVNSTMNSTE